MIQHLPLTFSLTDNLLSLLIWTSLEALVWVAIIVISEPQLPRVQAAFQHATSAVARFASRRRLAIISVFLLLFAGRIALLHFIPVPPPKIPDEFSAALSGDTFAHWRVTNPTHPMWRYFETIFVNQKPTYNSMYPPGIGLFMAAGQIVTCQPWYGILVSVALAAAAVCWMLQGWVPPRWALWGGLLFVLLAIKNCLTESYLGEGIVALGGALVLGAIPRIVRKRNPSAPIWLGLGVGLLAITRPYEGAVFVAGLVVGGFLWASWEGLRARTLLKRVAIPASAVLLPIFACLGYMNWRTTGKPLLAPYQLNLMDQHMTRPFFWQRPANPFPSYDYAAMANFYRDWEMNWWRSTHGSVRGFSLFVADKLNMLYWPIVWPLGIAAVLGCFLCFKQPNRRFLPIAAMLFGLGLGVETYQLLPKYAATAWGLVILLSIYGLRSMNLWKRRALGSLPTCRAAALFLPSALALCTVGLFLAGSHEMKVNHWERWWTARQQLLEALSRLPGKQLVVVRYSKTHLPYEEWVYNRSDVDSAKVVWARDSSQGDTELLRYFRNRTIWLLEPDGSFPSIMRYPGSDAGNTTSNIGPFRTCGVEPMCAGLRKQLEQQVQRTESGLRL